MTTRLLLALSLIGVSMAAQQGPRFTTDGRLMRPDNYREWVFLSSGLGMTYGSVASGTNGRGLLRLRQCVRCAAGVQGVSLETGTWPDKTIFALEIRSSASKGSINKGGHYQESAVGLEVEVKDESRFPNKWAFFDFSAAGVKTARPIPVGASC